MTEEQVEELRVYAEQFVIGGTDRLDRSVLRLLEERKRLLAALKPMVEATRAATFRKAYYDAGLEGWLAELDRGYAAVAFAEEPAR